MSNDAKDLFNLINGLRSGVKDGLSLAGDIARGDVHKAVTDTRSLFGDGGDVLKGLAGLGAHVGPVAAMYDKSPFGKLSDSPILSAAQLVIEGERALLGSGAPEDAHGYRESAKRLDKTIDVLCDANPHADRWDGIAATTYQEKNDDHRRKVSNVQGADEQVAAIIGVEAGQVSRSRQTLDDTSQYLYDYGLATAVLNFTPASALIKRGLDMAAASAALTTTNTTMLVLGKNVAENAIRLRKQLSAYEDAARDTSGTGGGPGAPFVKQSDDLDDAPRRTDPTKPYELPDPEEPRQNPSGTPLNASAYR